MFVVLIFWRIKISPVFIAKTKTAGRAQCEGHVAQWAEGGRWVDASTHFGGRAGPRVGLHTSGASPGKSNRQHGVADSSLPRGKRQFSSSIHVKDEHNFVLN